MKPPRLCIAFCYCIVSGQTDSGNTYTSERATSTTLLVFVYESSNHLTIVGGLVRPATLAPTRRRSVNFEISDQVDLHKSNCPNLHAPERLNASLPHLSLWPNSLRSSEEHTVCFRLRTCHCLQYKLIHQRAHLAPLSSVHMCVPPIIL